MKNKWVKIYSSGELHKIEILKALLLDNNIQSFYINKKDSSYISLGEVELYVMPEDEVLSKVILNNHSF